MHDDHLQYKLTKNNDLNFYFSANFEYRLCFSWILFPFLRVVPVPLVVPVVPSHQQTLAVPQGPGCTYS